MTITIEPKGALAYAASVESQRNEFRRAWTNVLIGGNHLACVLIAMNAAGLPFPPYHMGDDEARDLFDDDPSAWDAWYCWATIMRERDRLVEVGAVDDLTVSRANQASPQPLPSPPSSTEEER